MAIVDEIESRQGLVAWAFSELQTLMGGFRYELEPMLPQVTQSFNLLDAQISAFIAEGQQEQKRIQVMIEELEDRQLEQFVAVPDQTTIAQDVVPSAPLSLVGSLEDDYNMVPDVQVLDENGFLLNLDTSKGINLPDTTIDPRDGGTYTSEIPLADDALQIVQLLQDQVPTPIQSLGNTTYNAIVEGINASKS